ncbi:hypothetical protein ACFW19_17325 [Streptomyces nigra]|uniref:hypothetical protein n=1 Tax=Streptomyces nigra TaxID=1827580 RepID=UPI0036CCF166
MRYYCRDGSPPHYTETSYCDEHDCDTVVVKAAQETSAPPPEADPSDPIADLLREPVSSASEAPRTASDAPDDVQLPVGVQQRFRILEMLPAEAAVGGRLWVAAPVGRPQGLVLLKVHAPGFRPSAAKERLRSAGASTRLEEGVESLPDGGPTVTWETLRLPSGGTLRNLLDGSLARPGGAPGRLGGLAEPTVQTLLIGLADLLERWAHEARAVPVHLSPDTLYLRDLGEPEVVLPDLDGAAVLDEECARGPRPPLSRYAAPAHLATHGRWGERAAWVSVSAVVHELLTGRPWITAGPDRDELADAVLHRPPADTGDPDWDDLLDRLATGRSSAAEVRTWCAEREAGTVTAEPFPYGDRVYDDPAELVSALVDAGVNGPLWLTGPEHTAQLDEWLAVRAPHADRGALDRFLRAPDRPYAAEQALASLAAEFLPFARPRFRGDDIDEDGLVALAAREDMTALHAVLDSGVLRDAARQTCARHPEEPGCPVLRGLPEKVDRALETAAQETHRTASDLDRERAEETDELRSAAAQRLVPHGPGWYDRDEALRTVVRLLLGDQAYLRHCRERLAKTRRPGTMPRWWGRLYDATTRSLGREDSGALGSTAAGQTAAALAFDDQVVAFHRDVWRSRRVLLGRQVRATVRRAAAWARARSSRSVEDRDAARGRTRARQDLAHSRLLKLRWIWLTAFTIGLLDVIGYTAYGWVPYVAPSAPASASASVAPRLLAAGRHAAFTVAASASSKKPRPDKAKPAPDAEPDHLSRSRLWSTARADAAPNAGHLVTELQEFSGDVDDSRPEWWEDGALFGYGTRVPVEHPWLIPGLVLAGSAAGLRWAVRARSRSLRLTSAVTATVTTAALLWHLYADGLTHALLAATYALDFWKGTLWVVGVVVIGLMGFGGRGSAPVESPRTPSYVSRYGS